MRKIRVTISIGLVGCKRTETFDVEDDATEEEIEEMAKEAALESLNWNWEEKPQ